MALWWTGLAALGTLPCQTVGPAKSAWQWLARVSAGWPFRLGDGGEVWSIRR